MVVQADDLLTLATTVVCNTSQSAPSAGFHPAISVEGQATFVLCEMVGAIDARSLGREVTHLTIEEMRTVEDALHLVLDLA